MVNRRVKLYYDNSKDLYEGLIIEDDNGVQSQVAQVFPAFRDEYGNLFAAAPKLYEALKNIINSETISSKDNFNKALEALAEVGK